MVSWQVQCQTVISSFAFQGNILKSKLLKLEERLKEERKKRDLVTMKKPKTIVELILLTLKYGEAEDDFIDKIEGRE